MRELNAALVQAAKLARSVAKDATNSFHKYAYASAEAIIDEARSVLTESGLMLHVVEQRCEERGFNVVVRDNTIDKQPLWWLVSIYGLVHVSGEGREILSEIPILPEKGRPLDKAVNGAKTSDLAYVLRGLLLLPRGLKDEPSVDGRDDTDYDPSRSTLAELRHRLTQFQSSLGAESYNQLVTTMPLTREECEAAVLACQQFQDAALRDKQEREGSLKMVGTLLRQLGGATPEQNAALLEKYGCPDRGTLASSQADLDMIKHTIEILTAAVKTKE